MAPKVEGSTPSKAGKPLITYELAAPDFAPLGSYVVFLNAFAILASTDMVQVPEYQHG